MPRATPYGAYNFVVEFGDEPDSASPLGGFSDVSGIVSEINMMEYRAGNDKASNVRKVPGLTKATEVTFKRGIMGVKNFGTWLTATRTSPNTARNLLITLRDETGEPVASWKLINARPMKWTGPTLAAKGGSDVAMEELVVTAESLAFGD